MTKPKPVETKPTEAEVFLTDSDLAAYTSAMERIDRASLELQKAKDAAQFVARKLLLKYTNGKPAQIHPETGEVYIMPADESKP